MSKNIIIIGMPGSGKTTIGSLVSKRLNKQFIDMDRYIMEKENKSIEAMFKISEEYFRNAETKCTKDLSKTNSIVIATGGGIIKRKENIDYLKQNSVIVFLNRPIERIISDVDIDKRPLLKEDINNVHKLYNERIHLYKKYCDIEILNNKTIDDAINSISETISKMI